MLKVFSIALIILLAAFCLNDELRAEHLSPAQLKGQIKKSGARHVVQNLTKKSWKPFDQVCRKIETGKKEWLTVARMLKPGTDAGSAESLDFAVARALPKAPVEVLSMVQGEEHNVSGGFGLDDVCTVPFLEVESRVVDNYLKAAKLALEKMKTDKNHADLESLRQKCLQKIRSYIEAK